MLGPTSIVSAHVNQALHTDNLSIERTMFLLRVETVLHVSPAVRKFFADELTMQQAATEVGLASADAKASETSDETKAAFIKAYGELVELRRVAGLTFE